MKLIKFTRNGKQSTEFCRDTLRKTTASELNSREFQFNSNNFYFISNLKNVGYMTSRYSFISLQAWVSVCCLISFVKKILSQTHDYLTPLPLKILSFQALNNRLLLPCNLLLSLGAIFNSKSQ